MAVIPPPMPRGRLNFGSSSWFWPTSWKFFISPPDGIFSIGVRGCEPVYVTGPWEHAETTSNASGASDKSLDQRGTCTGCMPSSSSFRPDAKQRFSDRTPTLAAILLRPVNARPPGSRRPATLSVNSGQRLCQYPWEGKDRVEVHEEKRGRGWRADPASPGRIRSLVRCARLVADAHDARVVRDADALLRDLARVRTRVLQDIDAVVRIR